MENKLQTSLPDTAANSAPVSAENGQSAIDVADLELILALVRGKTLGGTAERLRVDASTVFRTIKRIEKHLGELLFERGRQAYIPTELGRVLAMFAERIESELEQARERAQPAGLNPQVCSA